MSPEQMEEILAGAEQRKQERLARLNTTAQHDDHDLVMALDEAHRARRAFSRMERQWSLVKEQGGTMPEAFWAAFGKAHAAVWLAERAVCQARKRR